MRVSGEAYCDQGRVMLSEASKDWIAKLTLPLSVVLPRKKKDDKIFQLNLNVYRNAHFHILNDAKITFLRAVEPQLVEMGRIDQYSPLLFSYVIFRPSRRTFDIMNVASVIDKFTCDAMIQTGVIKNDNHEHISRFVASFGGVDKDNPRCELTIRADNER